MKRMIKISLPLFFLLIALNNSGWGQTREKQGFKEFRIILERNIFDPDRKAPQKDFKPPASEETTPREQIGLLGVFFNGKESTIFFEGSQSSYNGEWKPGDVIAGFRIEKARTNGLVLEKNGRKINLSVGSVMTKTNREDWQISASPLNSIKSQEKESATKTDTKDESANDILQKLMERRRQENDQ